MVVIDRAVWVLSWPSLLNDWPALRKAALGSQPVLPRLKLSLRLSGSAGPVSMTEQVEIICRLLTNSQLHAKVVPSPTLPSRCQGFL